MILAFTANTFILLTLRDVPSPAKEGRDGPADCVGPGEENEYERLAGGQGAAAHAVHDHVVAIVRDEHERPDGAQTGDGTWKQLSDIKIVMEYLPLYITGTCFKTNTD